MTGEYFPREGLSEFEDKPKDKCGVVALAAFEQEVDVRWAAYTALGYLQHRGQESAGIAVIDNDRIWPLNDLGLARDVFAGGNRLSYLPSDAYVAMGHVRYGTCVIEGFKDMDAEKKRKIMRQASQPMVCRSADMQVDIAMGFNGDIPNYQDFIDAGIVDGANVIADGDIIKQLILAGINDGLEPAEAVKEAARQLEGSAFSLAVIFKDKNTQKDGFIAVRDPNGIKPFVLGSIGEGKGWIVASESPAIRANGGEVARDIEPGEMIIVDQDGIRSEMIFPPEAINPAFCAMDEIYLMRPDSEVYGRPVERTRFLGGRLLARHFPVEADMVVDVPDSGISAAYGYSAESGIPMRQGLIKNRTATERSFIAQEQDREKTVRAKLVANPGAVRGKRIVVVEDSAVRGNTLSVLIQELREAKVAEVHVRVASPPIISECHYGMDISTKEELVAHEKTIEEIRVELGADSIAYLDLPLLKRSMGKTALLHCFGCMTGQYPTSLRKPAALSRAIA